MGRDGGHKQNFLCYNLAEREVQLHARPLWTQYS